jgi:hypothetical protein
MDPATEEYKIAMDLAAEEYKIANEVIDKVLADEKRMDADHAAGKHTEFNPDCSACVQTKWIYDNREELKRQGCIE